MIIEEIIKTEGDYANYLRWSIEVFFDPLRRRDALSVEKLETISQGIDVLAKLHAQIYADLLGKESTKALIEAFSTYVPHLKLYADYCTKNSESMLLLVKCLKHNVEFKEFHETIRKTEARLNKLGLEDILMMPIQRICKYPLLFRELSKMTIDPIDSEAVQKLQSSLELVAQHVNDRKREAENNRVILKIQGSVEGLNQQQFFAKKRSFLVSMKMCVNANDIRRKLFLFDDLLLMTGRSRVTRGKKYELKHLFKLDECLAFYNIDPTTTFPFPLEMVDSNGKDPTVFTIGFTTAEDKAKFFELISCTQAVKADFRGVERRAPLVSYLPKQVLQVQEQFDLSDLHQRLLKKTKETAEQSGSAEAPLPKFVSSSSRDSVTIVGGPSTPTQSASATSSSSSLASASSSSSSPSGGHMTPAETRRAWARPRSSTTSTSTHDLLRRNLEAQQQQNEETQRAIDEATQTLTTLRARLQEIRNRHDRAIIDEFLASLKTSDQMPDFLPS